MNTARVFLFFFLFKTVLADSCTDLCECEYEIEDVIVKCKGARVVHVPTDLPENVTELYLSGTAITKLHTGAFRRYPGLTQIFFRDLRKRPCSLETLEKGSLSHLDNLRVIGIIGCERLGNIGPGVFGEFQRLDTIQMYRNGITRVPNLENFSTRNRDTNEVMQEIDLSNNKIEEIEEHAFMSIKTNLLKLDNNRIRTIKKSAFYEAQIVNLQISDNPTLTVLEDGAFSAIHDLKKLDLSRTAITSLPTAGISEIEKLILKDTKSLRHFPSVWTFNKIKEARLYYPHHCCAFLIPEKESPEKRQKQRAYEEAQRRIHQDCATSSSPTTQHQTGTTTPVGSMSRRRKRKSDDFSMDDVSDNPVGPDYEGWVDSPAGFPSENITWLVSPVPENNSQVHIKCGIIYTEENYREVDCTPIPDAFNPCEDVMGYEWLRIFVWFVVMAAILGNIVVLLVLASSKRKITVPKFLMCNLAFADFLMGVYLLLLASIDIHTLGEYFNYAILWQNEGGCQTAGFLTVFSSELSIFTLTVITLERWYAISHAIHLTKRLKLRQAVGVMAAGWLYAVIMAMLPLLGISDYGNVSVCLPMQVENATDQAYVISLLMINGVAFLCICCCYINMYWQVRNSDSTARSSDATIAKRMAMLVFTNFVCWAPIAFFGLTASSGLPLIDISNSKILLVFFYPLNSCANPFLYVIITKQFRKDMFAILDKYGICKDKASKYKLTVTSKSLTQSRKDSLALHNIIHPINSSVTQVSVSFKGSKNSLKISTGGPSPSITPKGTPKDTESPITTQVRNEIIDSQCERKLSIVRETNMSSDDFGEVTKRYSDAKEPNTPPTFTSPSEYVIFFPGNRKTSGNQKRPSYGQQFSSDTYSSSQSGNCTELSCLSDVYTDASNTWELREGGPGSTSSDTFYPISEEENAETALLNNKQHMEGDVVLESEDDVDDDDIEDKGVHQALLGEASEDETRKPQNGLTTRFVHFQMAEDDEGIDVTEKTSNRRRSSDNMNSIKSIIIKYKLQWTFTEFKIKIADKKRTANFAYFTMKSFHNPFQNSKSTQLRQIMNKKNETPAKKNPTKTKTKQKMENNTASSGRTENEQKRNNDGVKEWRLKGNTSALVISWR
ncbi:follicle-stimulating hormone receptor-like [Ylistrum balloti]|uniref:follicle-stimulating hormone receptor-like n=1 Tax=Ylistrum balloti TaxID=509963 RepID=UPI002905F5A8|nr:follicle-stimulating hormone receptor-like [Ylistrum balloti]